jgi:acyl carrier protein
MPQQYSPPGSGETQLLQELGRLLAATLGLPTEAVPAEPGTRLLGALPELDSMSVVSFLLGLEEHYGIVIHDDEVDASIFDTLGNLAGFVGGKLT